MLHLISFIEEIFSNMQNITKRLIVWAVVVAFILLIPLILTIRDGGVSREHRLTKHNRYAIFFILKSL